MSGANRIDADEFEAARTIKSWAADLGFVATGITASIPPPRYHKLLEWLQAGHHGSMHYLQDRVQAYSHPDYVLEGSQRLILLATPYSKPSNERMVASNDRDTPDQPCGRPMQQASSDERASVPERSHGGRLAAYASGARDYHDVLHEKLKQLIAKMVAAYPQAKHRGVVDTAPLLEREFASLAGLGWIGKNTLLLTRRHGSYIFLAAILTTLPLAIDAPFEADHCGTCRACLDACPTDAFPQAYVLDATRCISYLTIEHRGLIDDELKPKLGEWLFGCDVCQQVCPWNRRPIPQVDPQLAAAPEQMEIALLDILRMSPEAFRERFRRRPQWRVKYEGMLRNAAIAAGNQRLLEAIPDLKRLAETDSAGLRDAAHWALAQMEPPGSPPTAWT